jgi:hypothetical protein
MTIDADKLHQYFSGRTITRVRKSSTNDPECVGEVLCSDGSIFKINKTDIGPWVKTVYTAPACKTFYYIEFDRLVGDVFEEMYHDDPDVGIKVSYERLTIETTRGTKFQIDFKDLSEEEQRILTCHEGIQKLKKALRKGRSFVRQIVKDFKS